MTYVAECENYLEIEDRPCHGWMFIESGDIEGVCIFCRGRCGWMVAKYIGPAPEGSLDWVVDEQRRKNRERKVQVEAPEDGG